MMHHETERSSVIIYPEVSTDVEALIQLYSEDAINYQVVEEPVEGRNAIREMFVESFSRAIMKCIVENIFEDGEWIIMEWWDPLGLR